MNLARLLLEHFRWFDDALRARLADQGLGGLTSAESMVFPYLDSEGTRPAELARRLGITRQSTQTLVRGLERKGLVELADDQTDGRAKTIRLTRAGKRSVPLALETFVELELELATRIGAEKVAHLRDALEADWGDPPEL